MPQSNQVTIFRLAGQLITRLSVNEMQVNATKLVVQNGVCVSLGGEVLVSDSLFLNLLNGVLSTAYVTRPLFNSFEPCTH